MRKNYLKTLKAIGGAFALICCSLQVGFSQVVSDYTFTSSAGTYTPITGGTVYGNTSSDDQRFVDPVTPLGGTTATGAGIPIGFNFVFNGYMFDRIAINTNGWISLGHSSLGSSAVNMNATSTAISTASTHTPNYLRSRIVGIGRDLVAQTGSEIRVETIGTAPNRTLVVQWSNYRKYTLGGSVGDNYNFQIRLTETSNQVDIVYGTMVNNATNIVAEVGLGGSTNTDFNNRTTTTNWSATTAGATNSATCTFTNSIAPASGLTYTWQPPTCPRPTVFALGTVGSNNVALSWTAGGTESNWDIVWGTPGFVPGDANQIGATTSTSTSTTVNSLTPTTNYHIYVRANCGGTDGTSFWVGPLNFTTIQTPVTLPFTEDFSSNNWVLNNGTQTNKWFVGSADGNPANALYISDDVAGATTNYAHTTSVVQASKTITFTAGTSPFELSFDWKAGGETGNDYFRVWLVPATATLTAGTQITTGNTTGAVQLGANHLLQATWANRSYLIPASYAGTTAKLVFEWRNNASLGTTNPSVVLDNIHVKSSTCPPPTAFTATATSPNSVNASWTAGASETSWNVVWGPTGFTPGGSGQVGSQVFTTNSGTISGLTANTTYQFYVQSDCGSGDLSLWTGPVSSFTGYCVPTVSANNADEIRNFTLSNLNNSSAASEGVAGYSNYSTTIAPAQLVIGQSYIASILSGGGSGNHGATIWIDYNDNLIFEASERVAFIGNTITPSTTTNFPAFTVSNTPGLHRLRVGYQHNVIGSNIDPCTATSQFSEYEDYAVVVFNAPVSPSITQASATPDCTTGTELSTTGTPNTGEAWYWQTTATGTSTANVATTPWTVMENGTYYVRSLNTTYNVWSTANSITVSNVPVAPAPPMPVADQNPACAPGTNITVPVATGTLTYYWQGTSNTSSNTTNNATAPFAVATTGTYYVKAFDSATNCWSDPAGVLVTIDNVIPNNPVVDPSEFNFCNDVTSAEVLANVGINEVGTLATTQAGGNGCTNGNMFNLTAGVNPVIITSITVTPNATNNQTVAVYYKVGTYVGSETNNAAWTLVGNYPISGVAGTPINIDIADFTIPASTLYGVYVNYNAQYTDASSTYSTPALTMTTGAGFCTAFSGPIAGRTFNGTIHYQISIPATATWYDAATGGNQLGTGSPFETVGTSVLPTVTNGTYEFYVASTIGGCQSVNRALVTVNINAVNVDLTAIDVTCNNGNDGSFSVSNIDCGLIPFAYSVNGGAFGALPSDLTEGTYTVIVRDANNDISPEYTITIGSAAGPSALDVTSYNNDQAVIVWNANGSETEWNIEWGVPGFTPGTGNQVGSATATDTTYTITGLDGDTEYDIYVSANCGVGTTTGDWVSTDVTTDCDPMAAIGYCEDFEDVDALGCWKVINANGDADFWRIYTGYANSGNQSMGLYTDFNAGNNNDYLVMPRMTLTGNEILTFHYRARSSGEPNDFRVVLSQTGAQAADFTQVILPLMTVSNTVYKDTSINLSAYSGDVYIAFHVPSGGLDGYYLYIDDVCVDICNPVPGTDGTTDVCRTAGTVDLNTVITSQYSNGTWSFPANPSVINGSNMNISTLANGTYDVMYVVTTACTSDTTVASITVGNPSSAGTNGVLTVCKSQFIDLYGGLNGNVDFGGTWYTPNGTAMTSSYFQTGTLPGQFVYKYIVSNGICGPDTAEVTLNILNCVGLEDVSLLENVTIAPNPNTGNFQIIGVAGADYTFEVLDVNGRVIRESIKITSTTTDVNLTDVENGVYMVRIFGNNNERMMRVIKH